MKWIKKIAYFNDCPVGAVCCRKEAQEGSRDIKLYIMTLGVLAPYRNLKIGKSIFQFQFQFCDPKRVIPNLTFIN